MPAVGAGSFCAKTGPALPIAAAAIVPDRRKSRRIKSIFIPPYVQRSIAAIAGARAWEELWVNFALASRARQIGRKRDNLSPSSFECEAAGPLGALEP